jgi:DNA-binding CsgD family transcriptional regulator
MNLTYRDYLQQLTKHPQLSSWDYGVYLQEMDRMRLFAQNSSTVLFLLDYSSKEYPYMDQNTRHIMGQPNEAFYEGGLEFMLHHMPTFSTLNQDIHQDRLKFLTNHQVTNLDQLRFSMSYHFKGMGGEERTILQRNTVIRATEQNLPVTIFGFAWDITNQTSKGRLINQIEQVDPETGDWVILLSKEYYPGIDKDKLLSKREIEILKWVIEGHSSKQIANKLHVSPHTINTHRQNMLRKTNCQNSMDLLRYAVQCGFI